MVISLQPLEGVRVLDMATVVAGPGAARHLADFGADVIKIERPGGDSTRNLGWRTDPDDDSLYWKIVNRGKRCVSLDLKDGNDREYFLDLVRDSDVLVENMRPGRLEKLGLAPSVLHGINPRLVILRVTGFGQDGPYSQRPGFATNAEALSGLAGLLGEPEGAPLLPPIALTDEVTALVGAFAVVMGLRKVQLTGAGDVIDISLLESMLQLMGPLPSAFVHLGYLQPRLGSGIPYSVPRGTYRCRDGVWIALSSSAESVAQRILTVCGLEGDARFANFQSRSENRTALEEAVTKWISERDSAEVVAQLESADAAISYVHDMKAVVNDPHIQFRGSLVDVDGITMQGPVARFSSGNSDIRWPGPSLPEHGTRVTWNERKIDNDPQRIVKE